MAVKLTINGKDTSLDVDPQMPLLWAIRDIAGLTGDPVQVAWRDFDTYPMIRMSESPKSIHVDIMAVDAPPGGVGEPGVPPVAPAILNVHYAATKKRVRELPLRNAGLV